MAKIIDLPATGTVDSNTFVPVYQGGSTKKVSASVFATSTGGGGKPRLLIYRKILTTSAILTLPAGYYDIIAIGAGGSGARAVGATPARATGGGGPAWARDWGRFLSPTTVTFTAGARGAGLASSTVSSNGNDGGTTTVTGIDSPITLTGGKGGKFLTGSVADLLGGDGGIATGGKIRADGSRGGSILSSPHNANARATGGGAVDLFVLGSNATRGGDIVNASASANSATGGGGIGGRGGDSLSATSVNTSGGGAGGDALDSASSTTTPGPTIVGVRGNGVVPPDAQVIDILLSYPSLSPVGSGAHGATLPSNGGGSGGVSSTASAAASLGATGGTAQISTAGTGSGTSSFGGGSGAVAVTASTSATVGDGGQPIFIISVYEEVL